MQVAKSNLQAGNLRYSAKYRQMHKIYTGNQKLFDFPHTLSAHPTLMHSAAKGCIEPFIAKSPVSLLERCGAREGRYRPEPDTFMANKLDRNNRFLPVRYGDETESEFKLPVISVSYHFAARKT